MTPFSSNGLSSSAHHDASTGEDTLRMIANLPAPAGLSNRIKTGLASAPEPRRILMGRGLIRPNGAWMLSSLARGAAAAAIVGIVAGGGWGIYSHVPAAPSADLISVPGPAAPLATGFSNAGAKRVPETLQGPVLKHPLTPGPERNVIEEMPSLPKTLPGRSAIKRKTSQAKTPPLQ